MASYRVFVLDDHFMYPGHDARVIPSRVLGSHHPVRLTIWLTIFAVVLGLNMSTSSLEFVGFSIKRESMRVTSHPTQTAAIYIQRTKPELFWVLCHFSIHCVCSWTLSLPSHLPLMKVIPSSHLHSHPSSVCLQICFSPQPPHSSSASTKAAPAKAKYGRMCL